MKLHHADSLPSGRNIVESSGFGTRHAILIHLVQSIDLLRPSTYFAVRIIVYITRFTASLLGTISLSV